MFRINLDVSEIVALRDSLSNAVHESVKLAGAKLAAATKAHIIEQANQKLHTRRKPFVDHLSLFQTDDDSWIVNLDRKYRWIDDGMDSHEMIDDLLKSGKAKTAKDGSRYLSVPFDHSPGKGPTGMTQAQSDLVSTIKKELKAQGIPFGKLETGPDGKPKLGVLHNVNIMNDPLKTKQGPGQGWGAIGAVRQGPTGIPFLKGIRISQEAIKTPEGKDSVKRSIMTFRTVSSKMRGSGRWVHPGLEPLHIFEDAAQWALDEWKKQAVSLMADIVAKV